MKSFYMYDTDSIVEKGYQIRRLRRSYTDMSNLEPVAEAAYRSLKPKSSNIFHS